MAEDQVLIDWGDDTPPEQVPVGGAPRRHVYGKPGTYVVTVRRSDGQVVSRETVVIKGRDPQVHSYTDADDPWRLLVWLDEPDDGTLYRITWGDGSPPETYAGQRRVPPHPRVPHQYKAEGRYTATVVDLQSRRSVSWEVTMGGLGALITWDAPRRPRAEVLWLRTGAQWEIDDSAGTVRGVVPASGRVFRAAPRDAEAGEHQLRAREYVAGAVRRELVRRYMVPTHWDWSLGVALEWRDVGAESDPAGWQSVKVTPDALRTSVTVEWGDGSTSVIRPDDSVLSATHLYDLDAMHAQHPQGWLLRVTESDDVDQPRVFSRRLARPAWVGQPVMSSRDAGAVDVMVAGAAGAWNDDWYRIDWGDAIVDELGAVGRWYPAHHRYTRDGAYLISVDGPGMPQPVVRRVVVATYPGPSLTVAEDRDAEGATDPERRTVRVVVDNRASGGPCTVDMGDGQPGTPSTRYQCQEQDSFTHQYAAPARAGRQRYWVVVSSDADPTAQARAVVELPFGHDRTLVYALGPDTTDDTRPTYRAQLTVTSSEPGKEVQVAWDGVAAELVPPSGVARHTYRSADEPGQPVTVSYTDGSESHEEFLTIPLEEAQ